MSSRRGREDRHSDRVRIAPAARALSARAFSPLSPGAQPGERARVRGPAVQAVHSRAIARRALEVRPSGSPVALPASMTRRSRARSSVRDKARPEPVAPAPSRGRSPERLAFRRDLRRRSTEAERRLWKVLRSRGLGAKFRRQHSVGPYVVDFFCAEHRLAIELDGGQHRRGDEPVRDARRTAYLASRGIKVVRFTNLEWFYETDEVIRSIWTAIGAGEERALPRVSPTSSE